MADAAVQSAIYQLGYSTGDSKQQLDATRASADKLVQSTDAISVSEDKVTKATRTTTDAMDKLLAKLDPRIRAEQNLQKVIDQVTRIEQERTDVTGKGAQAIALAQAKVDKFNASNDNSRQYLTRMSQAVTGLNSLLGTFGVALGAAAVIGFGKSVFSTTADLGEQAQQLGVNVEAMQAYRAIFLQNGIAQDAGDKILARLTRSLGDAAEGSKQAQDAFHQLGLGSKELAGQGADAALPLIAQKLLDVKDATTRATIETALFGKTGQELESSLKALASGSVNDLIARAKQLGVVIDTDLIEKADEAKDKMALSWLKLQVSLAPIVTEWADDFSHMTDSIGNTTSKLEGLIDTVKVLGAAYVGARIGGLFGPIGAVAGGLLGAGAAVTQNQNKNPDPRRFDEAGIEISPAVTEPSVPFRGLITNDKRNVPAPQARPNIPSDASAWKPTKEDVAAYAKIKETFDGYLKSVQEAAQLAGETTAQRETEQAVIKGAVVAEKEHGVAARDTSKTYADAVKYLGQAKANQIEIEEAQKRINALNVSWSQQQLQANVALATNKDGRDLALKDLQDQIAAGGVINANGEIEIQLTQQQKDEIDRKNAAIQHTQDLTGLGDYMSNLKEEASLAGLSADERERESAILQEMHATHGTLTADQAKEISGIISARQETERWRQVVDGIASGFQSFFEDVLENGKFSFGKLFDSIKAQFAQLLAYMASQALIQPIIIPMVQEFSGSLGLGGATGLTGGGGAGGLLSSAGNLGSLFGSGGGSDFLGLGSSLGGIGSALGFSAGVGGGGSLALGSIAGVGGAPMSLGAVSGATPALSGSLFGATTLGSFAGGLGLGALAGNLVFGNKNDASTGSLGGAAAGALIGSIIPGVGTIIGGLIGGLAGGGLGSMTGSSNQGGIANFSDGGMSNYLFKQGSAANGSSSSQAANSISQTLAALQQSGLNVNLGNITGLSVGSDKSYVYDSAGGKQKLAGNDPDAVVNAILTRILPSASASTPQAQAILDKYNANGGINAGNLQQLETDLGAAQSFADALNNLQVGPSSLSDAATAIKQINDQIDPLVKQAQSLGLSTDSLETVRSSAIQALVQQFDDSVSTALRTATDPVGAQLDALLASQATRLQNAQDLGADISQLNALNDAEMKSFFGGLSADQLKALQAANDITAASQSAFDAAMSAAAVATGFTTLGTSIQGLVDQANDAAAAANNAASAWGAANDNVVQASQALLLSDPSLSPADLYSNARTQFDQLKTSAYGGDAGSASDLASFASQYLQDSFQYNGSTQAYGSDVSYVQNTLKDLATFSSSQETLAQQQADSAAQAVTVLESILTSIQNQTSETSDNLSNLSDQVGQLAGQIKTLALQLRVAA